MRATVALTLSLTGALVLGGCGSSPEDAARECSITYKGSPGCYANITLEALQQRVVSDNYPIVVIYIVPKRAEELILDGSPQDDFRTKAEAYPGFVPEGYTIVHATSGGSTGGNPNGTEHFTVFFRKM